MSNDSNTFLNPNHWPIHIYSTPVKAISMGTASQLITRSFDPEKNNLDRELVESIRSNGVVEPIMLQELPRGILQPASYEIIFGNRRFAAACLAGLEQIPAIVVKPPVADLAFGLAENLGHLPVSHYERAVQLENYRRAHPGETAAEIGQKLGMSKTEVNNLIAAFEDSSPFLRLLLHSQTIEIKVVLILQPVFARLAQEEQITLLKLLRRGISRTQAWELRNLIEQGMPPSQAAEMVICGSVTTDEVREQQVDGGSEADQPSQNDPRKNQPDDALDQLLGTEEKLRYLHICTGISP